MSGRVIVVGSINLDLITRVERLPLAGETVGGGAFEQHHGGKGANQAVAAHRLGSVVEFVGAVGRDAFGDAARSALRAEGVGIGQLRTIDDHPTGVALILVEASGENMIAVAPGANASVGPDEVAESLVDLSLTAADVLLVSHEIPTAAARAALLAARRVGARSIFNPALATGLDRASFGLADLITPNRGELATLVVDEARRIGRAGAPGESDERQARDLLESNAEGEGPRRGVVVTLGPMGALIVARTPSGLESSRVAAPAIRAVDTTGAGDTFNGTLAAGIAEGRSLDDAVRRAVLAAGLATMVTGAREGMPRAAELEGMAP